MLPDCKADNDAAVQQFNVKYISRLLDLQYLQYDLIC